MWVSSAFAANESARKQAVALPRVVGPIPVTRSSHPFMSASRAVEPFDLKKTGYVEEEYFVSGQANVYDYASGGGLGIKAPGAPYTTRILVRRPSDPRRFSGNVIVELLNPSDKFDADLVWELARDRLVSNGDAYVGITSKPVAAAFLKRFDPKRYAALSWANPVPADQTCKDPGPALLRGHSVPETEDGLIWDIVTQVGALLKSKSPTNPLANFHVQYLYQSAYSQTGAYVGTYVVEFQPHALLPGGKPIYDGFLIATSSGVSAINQCVSPPGRGDPRSAVRSSAPVIRIMTLTDFYMFGPFPTYLSRRPDSDAPSDRYRLYEVAGDAHVVEILDRSAPADDEVAAGGLARQKFACKETESDFPSQYVFDGALANLERWVRDGEAAPHADRITVSKPGDPSATPITDEFGNVKGGVRTPYVDVPTATYYGTSTAAGPDTVPPTCTITGHQVAFDQARLQQIYPTHDDYTRRVDADVDRLVMERWITDADGQRIKDQARNARVP
ncbi:MAG: alpha/beta hydrolase domain-containing protein [Terriglobales bacterium]